MGKTEKHPLPTQQTVPASGLARRRLAPQSIGLMISQLDNLANETEGATVSLVEEAMNYGFFKCLQIIAVPYAAEREGIARLVAEHEIALSYCTNRYNAQQRLDLSSLDKATRRSSLDETLRKLDEACQARACIMEVQSGPNDADERSRKERLKYFGDSLAELCAAALPMGKIEIVVEPGDVFADKKKVLGFTDEAVALVADVRQSFTNVGLCLDTAHMLLNEEDVAESLVKACPYISEFHFCNCVTHHDHELYGDKHLPFGAPGCLDVAQAAALFVHLDNLHLLEGAGAPKLFCEVLNRSRGPQKGMAYIQSLFEAAWESAQLLA